MNKLFLIIGVALALVIGAILLTLSGSGDSTSQAQHLTARLATLNKIIDEGTTSIQNGDLKKLNSDASILVTGDQANIGAAIMANGIKKPSKEIIAAEADSETFARLKDAKLNGRFDTTYSSVLETKLDSTAALMKELQAKSSSGALDAALTKSIKNIDTLQDQLSKF